MVRSGSENRRARIGKSLRVNEQIRVSNVRLITDKGEQVGVVPIQEALAMARQADLDLVEVDPASEPPVCRIMDFGRFKYKQRKKIQQSRTKTHPRQMKEIRLHPKTDAHDISYRVEHAREFLSQGHRVQVNVFFKGRELAHVDLGRAVLMKFVDALADVSKPERPPKLEGRKMGVLLVPKT